MAQALCAADYPAAHSTDTWWFAVDRDGHVASFDSGEEGCVPDQVYAFSEGQGLEEIAGFAEGKPPGELLVDARGFVLPGPLAEVPHRTAEECASGGCLMFPSTMEAVAAELSDGQALAIPSFLGFAVRLDGLSPARWKELHEGGACLGCTRTPGWLRPRFELRQPDEMPARWGFYQYEHQVWGAAGPYSLMAHPREPVRLDALPAPLQRLARAVTFGSLCFAETPYLQPAEHFNCSGWLNNVLSSDCRILRPREGDEVENADTYEEWLELGVKIVPEALRFPEVRVAAAPKPTEPAGFADWLRKLLGK